ncbi:MAG: single-stranded DNA-binding protein [Lachnospiraceae bacterium]|nr:single-stranded DNA-binding protein [Lachnospiraceae bacterium]
MNKVIMMGRLTRDPEVRYSQGASSTAVGRFSIAVDRRFKREGQPDADFFNCTTFGKQAEFVEKYLKKGTKVVISGSVQNDNYTDKDGNQRYSVQIICDEIEFAESKNAQGGGDYQNGNGGFQGNSKPAVTADSGDGFMNSPTGIEDELPFT